MLQPGQAGAARAPAREVKKTALGGLIGAACASLCFATITAWESGGKQHLKAYPDIVGVWTICDGETKGVRKGMTETPEGCAVRLDTRLAKDFAPAVLACTPRLKGRDYQLAAAISLAYNIGTGGYCRSTVDRRFDAGDWRGGCDAFLMWNKAGGKVVRGLDNRRRAERQLCLTGVK